MFYLIGMLLHCEVVVGCAHALVESVNVMIGDGRDARWWGAINRSRDRTIGWGEHWKKKSNATVGSALY